MHVLWEITLLPWAGRGRMMEAYLTAVCAGVVAILLAFPDQALETSALLDIGWQIEPRLIALPFALKAAFSGSGLVLSVREHRYSQPLRFLGGLVGSFLWFWLSFKFVLSGTLLMSFPFTAAAAYASIRIMAFSLVDPTRGRVQC
jgi:hypothetical protein